LTKLLPIKGDLVLHSLFTATAKIAHAGIKSKGYINGQMCFVFYWLARP